MAYYRVSLGANSKAAWIAHAFSIPHIISTIKRFSDRELLITFDSKNYSNATVIIVHSTQALIHDNIMSLLFAVRQLKAAGVQHIITVIPFFGYGRQLAIPVPGHISPAKITKTGL